MSIEPQTNTTNSGNIEIENSNFDKKEVINFVEELEKRELNKKKYINDILKLNNELDKRRTAIEKSVKAFNEYQEKQLAKINELKHRLENLDSGTNNNA